MSSRNFKNLILLSLLISLAFSVEILASTLNLYGSNSSPLTVNNNLLTVASPSISIDTTSSLCQANQVQNNQNVCIKPQYIEGCQTYETITTCSQCSNGYLLNKNKICDYQTSFTGIVGHIRGCIKQSSSTCDVCAEGFYMKENKCILGVKHCSVYNNDGQCTQCEIDYSLVLSQCRKNTLLGCKYETQSHTCQECYAPFTLDGQHCDIDQCKILNDYGCVSCECGFYLTPDRDCKPIASGCLRYEKGICKDCLPHYKLKGGVCEIQGCNQYSGSYCKKCSDKYDLIDGECMFKNCNDWLNDQCITCKQGFGLNNGTCVNANSIPCQ